MAKLLEGGIASIVYSAAKFMFLDATLARDTLVVNSPDVYEMNATTTTTTYSCKAIEDTWGKGELGMGLVDATDIKVMILANSLSVTPLPLDRITIRGKTVTVVAADVKGKPPVVTDPARATWELRCKG